MKLFAAVFVNTLCLLARVVCQGTNNNETQAKQFLEEYNTKLTEQHNRMYHVMWAGQTGSPEYNRTLAGELLLLAGKTMRDMRERALVFNESAMSYFTLRQLYKIKEIGPAAQPDPAKVMEWFGLAGGTASIYSRGKVCIAANKCLALEPDIIEIMATSRDYDKLLELWVGWRNETGRKMKANYARFVELNNEAVSILGYKNTGIEWRTKYEATSFVEELKALFDQIRPLYQQLHAYIRRHLKKVYGENRFPASGHIPAHILGNMWALHWTNIYDLVLPFKNKTSYDITDSMIKQNYTVLKMFQTAEDFFTSLGFKKLEPSFWTKSMMTKPTDGRQVSCHATAWDFGDQKDFRIKMCAVVNQKYFMIVHHEMGHIAYFSEYKDQPYIFRQGANDGFHEAIGDLMTLSVQTPEHLFKLGLISEVPTDEERDINFLMKMALDKVAFFPFGYLVDLWYWSVFSGATPPKDYNVKWWRLRCRYQGVFSPVRRSKNDFDPGSLHHIANTRSVIDYFVSYLIQFQFHKALCDAAGYKGPLHRCDIYNSTEAGKKLRTVLKLGSSRPWPVPMNLLTGQRKMDVGPLMEYFKPLYEFLKKENGNDYGWEDNCPQIDKKKP